MSFLARHGGDRFLLDTVQSMYTSLKEQADIVTATKSTKTVSQEQSAEMAKEKVDNFFLHPFAF